MGILQRSKCVHKPHAHGAWGRMCGHVLVCITCLCTNMHIETQMHLLICTHMTKYTEIISTQGFVSMCMHANIHMNRRCRNMWAYANTGLIATCAPHSSRLITACKLSLFHNICLTQCRHSFGQCLFYACDVPCTLLDTEDGS